MPLRTPDEFVAGMKARGPMDIWFHGEKIKDVLTHPALKPSLETIKRIYELAHHPKFKDLLTVKSHLTGEICNLYVAPLTSRDDAIQKTRVARALAEGFSQALNLTLVSGELTPQERAQAATIRNQVYASAGWNARV